MVKGNKKEWKAKFFAKVDSLVTSYTKILVVNADNVRSKQMQQIRIALRGKAELLMGKNTMLRKALRGHIEKIPELEALFPYIVNNIGLVFTSADLAVTRDLVTANKISAPARAGIIAPLDVSVPAGNTGMGPEKTAFFQALNINTKIVKGCIEIISDVQLIKVGDKVGPSEATLLNMLKVSPFSYGLTVLNVYDNGAVFDTKVLDITNQSVIEKFLGGVRNVASLSLAINYPTVASVPHSIINGFKNVVAIALTTEYSFKEANKIKEILANPDAFKVAAPVAAAPVAAKVAAPKAKEPEPEEEEEMGMSLFD